LDRGLLALGVADPSSAGSVADWPLGRRNRALFDLHASWFGPRLQGWTSCPSCGEKAEFELDARELAGVAHDPPTQDAVTIGDYAFRLPTTRDVAHVLVLNTAESAATDLLDRCRIDGRRTPNGPATCWSQ
jgi:hypothetical protein